MTSDGTHPGGGAAILVAYLADRITALESGVVVPKLSLIGSSRKPEGAAGTTTTYQFMVTRNTTAGTASVRWDVVPFCGVTVNGNDFAAGVIPSGTVTFADGSAHKTFDVVVKGDNTAEGSELFNVVLSDPSNGYGLYFATGRAQVTNDDGDPPLWAPDQLGAKLVDYSMPMQGVDADAGTWTGIKGVLAYAQADSARRPTYNTTSYGGLGAVVFDGVNDVLLLADPTKLPSSNAHFGWVRHDLRRQRHLDWLWARRPGHVREATPVRQDERKPLRHPDPPKLNAKQELRHVQRHQLV